MSTPAERQRHEAAVKAFEESRTLTPEVLEVVKFLGATGCNCYPWLSVRPILQARLEEVLTTGPDVAGDKREEYIADKEVALAALPQFDAAPFTLQRLCEVLTDAPLVGGRKDKLVWTLLKLLCIISTLPAEPFPYEQEDVEEEPGPVGMPIDTPIPIPPVYCDDVACVMPGAQTAAAEGGADEDPSADTGVAAAGDDAAESSAAAAAAAADAGSDAADGADAEAVAEKKNDEDPAATAAGAADTAQ